MPRIQKRFGRAADDGVLLVVSRRDRPVEEAKAVASLQQLVRGTAFPYQVRTWHKRLEEQLT